MTNTEKLIKVIEEKREEIIELSKQIYKNTMIGNYFQGWQIGLTIDTDGDISEFYRSSNSMGMDEYNGTAVAVINYNTCQEISEIIDFELTEEQEKNFKQWLLDNEKIEDLENWGEELNYCNVLEFDSSIIYKLENEIIEAETDIYYYETADEQINRVLENLQTTLQNEFAE